jgi:prepilin-type N-terminal cleavage/methylation domain-containing protein
MKIRKNHRGFTLVELLLVMAIIGILAGVIFVTTAPARKKARITTFKQHMKDMSTAGSVCVDDSGTIEDSSPNGADGTGSMCTVGNAEYPEIKECIGGSDYVEVTVLDNADNDDFVIHAMCNVASGTNCYAECKVGGCTFANTDYGDSDGCPETSATT